MMEFGVPIKTVEDAAVGVMGDMYGADEVRVSTILGDKNERVVVSDEYGDKTYIADMEGSVGVYTKPHNSEIMDRISDKIGGRRSSKSRNKPPTGNNNGGSVGSSSMGSGANAIIERLEELGDDASNIDLEDLEGESGVKVVIEGSEKMERQRRREKNRGKYDTGETCFNPPYTKNEAFYRVEGSSEFDESHDRCRDCVHYIEQDIEEGEEQGQCKMVEGIIEPSAYCKQYYSDVGIYAHNHDGYPQVELISLGDKLAENFDWDETVVDRLLNDIRDSLNDEMR